MSNSYFGVDGYHGFDAKIERGTHDEQREWEIGDTKPLEFLGEERKETGGGFTVFCAVVESFM